MGYAMPLSLPRCCHASREGNRLNRRYSFVSQCVYRPHTAQNQRDQITFESYRGSI